MTEYTKDELDGMAYAQSNIVRKETKRRAVMDGWTLSISEGGNVTLKVLVKACDGIRQRNIAI